MRSNSSIWFVLSIICFFSACSDRPAYVLSDKKMENVLFDLYIAETEIKENTGFFSEDSIRKQQLLLSVFKKHKISEQAFDTSLVWYNAHLEQYVKINTQLSERYALLIEDLKAEQERIRIASTVIDTLFVYTSPLILLQPALRENIYAFRSDTSLLKTVKEYDVKFTAVGWIDSIQPVLTFCIQCKDTTFVHRETILQSGLFSTKYSVPFQHQVQSVYGNFYLPDKQEKPALISNFTVSHEKRTITK